MESWTRNCSARHASFASCESNQMNGDRDSGELAAESTCCDSVGAVLENNARAGISAQATGGSNKYVGGRLAVAYVVGREHVLHAAKNLDKIGD